MRITYLLLIILLFTITSKIDAQIAPNNVDSQGLKQGLWREFKIPFDIATKKIGVKIPKIKSKYFFFTKDEQRKFFPIIECVGKYKNGLKTGMWVEYYGNGNLKNQINYSNGKPNGKCKVYWINGNLKEVFIINSNDSIQVLFYKQNGELLIKKKVSKILLIRGIYEN